MEWNGKPHLQWDWESLIMFNGITTENSKQFIPTDLETDGEKGTDSRFFYSSGSASRSGGSSSDLELPYFSKNSKSASINSSSAGEVKTSKFTLEASKANSFDYNKIGKAKTASTPSTIKASAGSGDQLLGLKLGKRIYFEDACAGSHAQSSSVSTIPVPSFTPAKKLKPTVQSQHASRCQVEGCNLDLSSAKDYHRKHRVCESHSISFTPAKKLKPTVQSQHASRCQVEGCNLDLSSAKDYHRKHRVCESHSKCQKVIVAGLERRFCQQCSRFHGLSEFDEKKKSCRRRLSDHNARRRKQPGSVHLNSRVSSSLYDERQQMSLAWDRAPFVHARPNANLTWENTYISKFTLTKEPVAKPAELGGIDGRFHLPGIDLTNGIDIQHHHKSISSLPSKGKGTAAEIFNQGLEEYIIPSKVEAAPESHCALSLLSNNSWGSCELQSISFEQPVRTNHTTQSVLQVIPQKSPLASSEYWRTEQPSTDSQLHTLTSH